MVVTVSTVHHPWFDSSPVTHWRQPRRGCRGQIPPPILLRTFGYSRPILVALRSLSLKPISFGYKTPPIRFSQTGGQSAHKARLPNLELALTPLQLLADCYNQKRFLDSKCVKVFGDRAPPGPRGGFPPR